LLACAGRVLSGDAHSHRPWRRDRLAEDDCQASAEVTTGLVLEGWAVAAGALADDVAAADVAALDAAPTADDVLGVQADSASPTPRPSAEMPIILVACVKCREFMVVSLLSL
jgi:hypothetical protein